MYRAFNNNVIVKAEFNDNFQTQVLEGEVVSTTKETEKLQGKFIIAPRHKYMELGETEDEKKTDSGIILGSKSKYASVSINEILAVKEWDHG